MKSLRIIPCLDVRDGRVVKGIRFQNLRDAGDPAACAARYQAQGADEIVLLDVSATPEGRNASLKTVQAVRRCLGIPLTVGGGLRKEADAARYLEAGADKVAVNTAAVENPGLLTALADRFGRQCIVLSLDCAQRPGGWVVKTHSGKKDTEWDAVVWAARAERAGAGEILLTSWDRDGTGQGYDLALLQAVRQVVSVPIVASGGARTVAQMAAAFEAGADAVLAASIFHLEGRTVQSLKSELAHGGIPVRPLENAL